MIRNIQIDRFKSLHHTPLVKLGRVNLLTGANGRGKSSFCQSLLTLSQTWRRGMMESLLPSGIWKDLGSFDDIVYAYSEDKTIGVQSAMVGGLSIRDDAGSSRDEEDEDELDDGGKESEIRLASLRDFPSLIALERMFYVAAERKAAPAIQPLDETTPHFYVAPDGSNVLNVLWKNSDRESIKNVQELLDFVLDGGRLRLDQAGDQLVLRINSVADGHFFQPVNVGYGYSYILSLLASVVLATTGSFIIVENPEAHLHPAAQAKVMNVLIAAATERNIQLIVETHSDHILNTALRAVNDHKLTVGDFEVLFFSNHINEDGSVEAHVQNLEVNQLGHILNPPLGFFEQYSIDLQALYAPPTRQERIPRHE